MIDLGTFEEFGYADVIHNGKSRKENCRLAREVAKKLGLKIKIRHVRRHPKGSVIWDVRTGRVALDK